ncbi:MAG: ABC transporter permease [Candidatus Margulisiibacteriota bacterium]|jgi:phospholipid/cholesterol/gamma-HCH transport system permease protein
MFYKLGTQSINFFYELGAIFCHTLKIFSYLIKGKIHIRNTIEQMVIIGLYSLPIIFITSLFVGMVFAVQIVKEFLNFGAGQMIGGVMGLAMWRELAPIMTGVVVAGRSGSAIAAEIGSMKVTEQIEALEAMSQDPMSYLITPRVVACIIMLPLLTGLADIIGFLGGLLISVSTNQVNAGAFIYSAERMLTVTDISGGLIKAIFFGLVISVIATYMGLNATAGAKGVGETTTKSVVLALVSLFIINYFLSAVLF